MASYSASSQSYNSIRRSIRQVERVKNNVEEVILAMNATVEGQTTAHYLVDLLGEMKVTRLAHGVPVGGELDYLDEGTLSAAFKARRAL